MSPNDLLLIILEGHCLRFNTPAPIVSLKVEERCRRTRMLQKELEADINRPRHPPWQRICLEFMSARKMGTSLVSTDFERCFSCCCFTQKYGYFLMTPFEFGWLQLLNVCPAGLKKRGWGTFEQRFGTFGAHFTLYVPTYVWVQLNSLQKLAHPETTIYEVHINKKHAELWWNVEWEQYFPLI